MAKLDKYVIEYSERNKKAICSDVYSVTNSQGFIPSTEYFSKEVYSKDISNYKKVYRNSLAFNPSRINVGSVAVQDKLDVVVVSPLYVVFKVDDSNILPMYLNYFMHSDVGLQQINNLTAGSVRDVLKFSALCEMELNIPVLSEQEKRINILSSIERLIYKNKKQLADLDLLVKSQFIEMFGDFVASKIKWNEYSLQELIDSKVIIYHLDGNHGGQYPRSEEFVSSGVPYIGANCIADCKINFSNAKYVTEERSKKFRKGIAKNRDVLFAHNATVGPVALLETKEQVVILGTSLTAFRCNENAIVPEYLTYYLKCQYFVRQYEAEMQQTTRKQVPITTQRKYRIVLPDVARQNKFAAFVKQVDKSKFAVQQSLNELELLKKKLMQDYFG